MKLRMEIIDQRSKVVEPFADITPPKTDYAKLWAEIMDSIPPVRYATVTIPAKPYEKYEKAAVKEIEKASAPEWGTKDWFYNTTIQAKEHQNQYVDSYGTVHRISAFT